ncbi:molybdate transport system substrate-binding protein [Erwinia toletana]|uniref:Molybdate transport system substrate-binding protein n=1 Tax=Winslowiella toletana TaxID=92490 RepID=A0ABS4P5V4_9GAMM|nr:molybdate ABC transporter substrate-binding protein [Winslowiella toletana]MBP2168008.1 molybdate transport system substrate-binding protein [Winslowiella toletana]
MLRVLAAGSLRKVWPALMAAFQQQSGIRVTTQFAPAGLLRQRIISGEPCDLFASANLAHPTALQQQGHALQVAVFAHNQLCLTAKADVVQADDNWLTLLARPQLRLATSTPESDPSGDYAWQLFDRIEQQHPGVGNSLKKRALCLVGGAESPPIPAGELAASWLINHHRAELFLGYASYWAELQTGPTLRTLAIAPAYQPAIAYAFAVCQPQAQPLAEFLLAAEAQRLLAAAGFRQEESWSEIIDTGGENATPT